MARTQPSDQALSQSMISANTKVEHIGKASYQWVMLTLMWCCYFSFGTLTSSMAPLVTLIMRDLGLGATQMGLILGTWQLVYVVVAFWAGSIIDRFGLKKSLTVGMFFLALSAMLRGFAGDFATLAIAVAVFGIGGPMISVGSPKLVSVWFSGKERGAAIGLNNTGTAVGSAVMLATANSVLVPLTGSWRGAVLVSGSVIVAFAVLWWLFARDAPAGAAEARSDTVEENPLATVRSLIEIKNVQLILLGAAATFAISHAMNNWLPKILESKGLNLAEAGLYAALPTVTGILSTIMVPRLAPLGKRRYFLVMMFSAQFATLLALWAFKGEILLLILPLLGLFRQGTIPLVLLILMDTPEVGSRHMGTAGGLYFALAELGGFGGPFALGFLLDWTHSFSTGILFLAGLTVFMAILSGLLREGKPS